MDRKNESEVEGFAKILVNLGINSQAIQLLTMTVPTYSIFNARHRNICLEESFLTSTLPRPIYEFSIFKRAFKAMKEASQNGEPPSVSSF